MELNRFKEFLKRETGSSKSGKHISYKQYLIKLFVHLQEIYDENIVQLESEKTGEQLSHITKTSGFSEFNQKNKRYYSSTYLAFKRYVKDSSDMLIEEQVESQSINDRPKADLLI